MVRLGRDNEIMNLIHVKNEFNLIYQRKDTVTINSDYNDQLIENSRIFIFYT